MKTPTTQAGNTGRTLRSIVTALAVASVIGGLAATPALGDNDGHHDKGWHKGHSKGGEAVYVYRPVYPYYYSAPVYAPAPVYYDPQPSPGISLFFPLHIQGR